MVVAVIFLIVGLGLLTYSAEHFVVGAGRLAIRLQLSAVVVGAVIIGFGTSAPELLVSATAAARDDLNLGTGNVVGSVVANLTLVLGITGFVATIKVTNATLRREAPLSVLGVVAFAWFIQNDITRLEGVLLLVALCAALAFMIWAGRGDDPAGEDVAAVLEELDLDHPDQIDLKIEGLRTLAGLVGTVVGSQLLVQGALDIADEAGISSGFVGVSLVALGTSLPELVTSIAAARKGATDLIIGNLLGSNMFNGLAVGAAMGLIGPGTVTDGSLTGTGTTVMVAVVALSTLFMITGGTIVRWEAAMLLAIYVVTIPILAADSDAEAEPLPVIEESSLVEPVWSG